MKQLKQNKCNKPNKLTKMIKKYVKKRVNNIKVNAKGFQASADIFVWFQLWSIPDLPREEIQLPLDCNWLGVRRWGNLNKQTNKRKITLMNTVICFLLFFPYTLYYLIWLAFHPRNYNHISVKLLFQLLVRWRKKVVWDSLSILKP